MDKNEEERKLEKIRIVSREEVRPIILKTPFEAYRERQLEMAKKIAETNIVDYPDLNDYNIQFDINEKKFIARKENEIFFTDKTYEGLINQIKKATKKILKKVEVLCLGKFYRSRSQFRGTYYEWYDTTIEDLEYLTGKITSFRKTSDYLHIEPSSRLWFTGKNVKGEKRRSSGGLHCFTLDNNKNREILEDILRKYDEINKTAKQREEMADIIEKQKEEIIELSNSLDKLNEEDLFELIENDN